MANPFESNDRQFLVLVNFENQHSLWPDFITPPAGWTVKYGPDNRAPCIDYINTNWTDMRPASLINQSKK